jgi:hypothetical protein
MSPDQELLNLAGAESESKTLFDELAGLVSAERQAEYYRVIAHTRTLSPNDEMLRILEAMGILALLTRESPAEIAAERKALRKILESAVSKADEIEKRMAGYTLRLESRIAQLPKELQDGLDPPRIAKLLGESLRQCFQQSGLPEIAKALDQSCSEMKAIQKQLVYALQELGHPEGGVIARVQSANESLLRSMATRAQQIDGLLGRLEKRSGQRGCLSLPVPPSHWASSWVLGLPANGKQHRRHHARPSHNRGWRLPTFRPKPVRSEVQSTTEGRSHRQRSQRTVCRTHPFLLLSTSSVKGDFSQSSLRLRCKTGMPG